MLHLSFLDETSWYFFILLYFVLFYFIMMQGGSELIAHLSDGCKHLLGGMGSVNSGVRPLAGSPPLAEVTTLAQPSLITVSLVDQPGKLKFSFVGTAGLEIALEE